MQNDQSLLRTQRIIEHLEGLWQCPQEPSPNELRQITEFIVSLQEPYRSTGLEIIARHTVSNMSLHILALMATFQQKAEQEAISPEDRKETFEHIQPEVFRILDELSKHVSVRSLDDLAALTNITVSLQTLSQNDSAEAAQSWLYELPTMYYRQLTQENLVVNVHSLEWKSAGVRLSQPLHPINWTSYDITGNFVLLGTGRVQVAISSEKVVAPIEVPIHVEPSKIINSHTAWYKEIA